MSVIKKIETLESGTLLFWLNKFSDTQVRQAMLNLLAEKLDVSERTIYNYMNGAKMSKLQRAEVCRILSITDKQLL